MSQLDPDDDAPRAPTRVRSREHGTAPRRLGDSLRIVRDHALLAFLAFVVGAGAIVVTSLRATPVYQSLGTIQMEDQGSGRSLLEELGVAENASNVEAELLVMKSLRVATDAARIGGLHATIEERDAYRPLETVLQSFGWRAPPCRLEVTAPVPPEGQPGRIYDVVVGATTPAFEVRLAGGSEVRVRGAFGLDGRADVAIDGVEVALSVAEGRPEGKTFLLRLLPLSAAGAWIRSGAVAQQAGMYTGFVSIGATGSNPHLVQRAARAIQQAYLEHKAQRKQAKLDTRLAWLTKERARVGGLLKEAEAELDRYVKAEGAALLSERAKASFDEQGRILAQRLEQQQALRLAEAGRADLAAAETADRILVVLGPAGADARTTALSSSLAQLEVELTVLQLRGTSQNDEVQRATTRIEETRRQLAEQTKVRKQQALTLLDRSIDAIRGRLKQLADEDAVQEARLKALPSQEREIAQRTRDVEASARAFEMLSRWEGEATIARASTVSSAMEIDRPLLPEGRLQPVLWRQAALATIVGLALAVLSAFVLHQLDHRLRSPQQLERATGLELYAAIPNFRTVRRRERRRILAGHGGHLPTLSAPTSVVAEAYRSLRANLRFAALDRPVRTLAITSAVEQEGKTVTTCNLAVVLAQARARVMVVDADLRRPSVHTVFGIDPAPGLSEVLRGDVGWKEALRPVGGIETLHVLPAGRIPDNPGALLDSPAFARLLTELKAAYDYVLFDVPPVLAVLDAAAFFRSLDAVVLLNRYRRCPADVVDGARAQIERLGGNVVGAIFNAFDARRAAGGGYGYYGYYGHYGVPRGEDGDERAERASADEPARVNSK